MLSTAHDEQQPIITDILIPVSIDGTPLKYDTITDKTNIAADKTNIVINHMVVRQEDQKMHRSLMYALSEVPDTAAALQYSCEVVEKVITQKSNYSGKVITQ